MNALYNAESNRAFVSVKPFSFNTYSELQLAGQFVDLSEYKFTCNDPKLSPLFSACNFSADSNIPSSSYPDIKAWFDSNEEISGCYDPVAMYYLIAYRNYSFSAALLTYSKVDIVHDCINEAAFDHFDLYLNKTKLAELPDTDTIIGCIDYERYTNYRVNNGDFTEVIYNGETYTVTNANDI